MLEKGLVVSKLVGIDVGGTFTDGFYFDDVAGEIRVAKWPTIPEDQSVGAVNTLNELTDSARDIDLIVHGTTMATNAVIERKGATCALITTVRMA